MCSYNPTGKNLQYFQLVIMKTTSKEQTQSSLFDIDKIDQKPKKEKLSGTNSYVFDLMDALTAPILTFTTSWSDTIPKRILNIIPMARMLSLMKKEQLATYPECAAYLYTRSLEAPMSNEWTEIYLHVCCFTLSSWFNEDHWQELKAQKELPEHLQYELKRLRNHIYEKRRQKVQIHVKSDLNPNQTDKPSPHLKKSPDIQQGEFDF